MNAKKIRLPKMVTPVGTLRFVWVDKPDDKFATATSKAKFKASVILDPKDEGVEAFIEALKVNGLDVAKQRDIELEDDFKFAQSTPASKGTKKKPLDEAIKGMYVLEAKTGEDYPPRRKDAANNLIEEDGVIRSGDRGRLAVGVDAYEAFGSGISLRLNAVQLIEKRSSAGGADGDFDSVEGGYTHGAKPATESEEDDTDDEDDDF